MTCVYITINETKQNQTNKKITVVDCRLYPSSAGDPEKKNDCIGIPKNSHSGHQPINRTT